MLRKIPVAILVLVAFCDRLAAQTPLTTPGTGFTVVEFSADWCVFCQAIDPDVQRLKRAGYEIVQLDIDAPEIRKIADKYGVKKIPTFQAYARVGDRWELRETKTLTTRAELEKFLAKHEVKPKPKPKP